MIKILFSFPSYKGLSIMNAVQILNAISTLSFPNHNEIPTLVDIDNVWHPYSDDHYIDADIHCTHGYYGYSFNMNLYVDEDMINIELFYFNDRKQVLNQNFKHGSDYLSVMKTVIEKKIEDLIRKESIAVWSRD
jgi:hypothetical protein